MCVCLRGRVLHVFLFLQCRESFDLYRTESYEPKIEKKAITGTTTNRQTNEQTSKQTNDKTVYTIMDNEGIYTADTKSPVNDPSVAAPPSPSSVPAGDKKN